MEVEKHTAPSPEVGPQLIPRVADTLARVRMAPSSLRNRFLQATILAIALLELYYFGIIPNFTNSSYFLAASFLLSLVFTIKVPGPRLMKCGFVLAGCCLGLALTDLSMRSFLTTKIYGPRELFMFKWAPAPYLSRFSPNVSFTGVVTGDLAHNRGFQAYQTERTIVFKTDSYGFRNDYAEGGQTQGPIDLIMLGDSFGTGVGTTQGETWASILGQRYQMRTYNLSMPESGPWQELMNLKIESKRLHTDKKTIVLWALFSGNDLDDPYGDELTPSVSHSWWGPIHSTLLTFRNLSPIRAVAEGFQWRLRHRSVNPVVARRLADGRNVLFRPRYQIAVERTYDQVKRHPNYSKLVAVIDEMKSFTDAVHLSVVVVMVPAKEEVYSWILNGTTMAANDTSSGFSKAVAERCDADGLTFLDLKPLLVEEARREFGQSGQLLWWNDDTHWNGRGQEFAAFTVYDRLIGPMKKAQAAGHTGHGINGNQFHR